MARKIGNKRVTALHNAEMAAKIPNNIRFFKEGFFRAWPAAYTMIRINKAKGSSTHNLGTYQKTIGLKIIKMPVQKAVLRELNILKEIKYPSTPRQAKQSPLNKMTAV